MPTAIEVTEEWANLEKHIGRLFLAFLDDDKTAYLHLVRVDDVAFTPKKTASQVIVGKAFARIALTPSYTFYRAVFRVEGAKAIPQDSYHSGPRQAWTGRDVPGAWTG